MGKWSWKARAAAIEEFAEAMTLDGWPSWDDLTLEYCIDEMKMILEMAEDVDEDVYDKRTAKQVRKFLADFNK